MNIDERFLSAHGVFCGYNIPVVTYTVEDPEKLNSDLVEIIDELEHFYHTTKSKTLDNNDGNTQTKSILTHNYNNFNIFDRTEYKTIRDFRDFVAEAYTHYLKTYTQFECKDVVLSAWGNKIGKFDFLNRHCHVSHLNNLLEISANYFIKAPNHKTYTRYYSPLTILKDHYLYRPNVEGHLTIFPSFVEHDTTANRHSEEYRYTLGMDAFHADENLDAHKCLIQLID